MLMSFYSYVEKLRKCLFLVIEMRGQSDIIKLGKFYVKFEKRSYTDE